MRTLRPLSVGVAVAGMAVVVAACGGGSSSSSSTTTTQSPAQATAVITTNWTAFFNGGNPDNNSKLLLLQNNSKLRDQFFKNYANPSAAVTAAKVTNVSVLPASQCQQAALTSPCAKVSYDLVNRSTGAPLLAGQTGYAVFQNGKWLVSQNTFCALISLVGGQCPA
ncbi:MAG TPA: hypothetical protein VH112_10310 [Acidimicrobiales bacterium]|nr:hypothetical protein [Acidimicrobiales bacterium]